MPTALSLKIVMEDLGTTDNKALGKLTGLSDTQIERCKKLLKFPEKFQERSLDLNPKTRIPSNFWIEALRVLDLALATSEPLKKLGRDRSTEKLVNKYRDKKIKSVIHFRRIMESYELSEDAPPTKAKVLRRVEEFFLNPKLETRDGFDEFVVEKSAFRTPFLHARDFCYSFRSSSSRIQRMRTNGEIFAKRFTTCRNIARALNMLSKEAMILRPNKTDDAVAYPQCPGCAALSRLQTSTSDLALG